MIAMIAVQLLQLSYDLQIPDQLCEDSSEVKAGPRAQDGDPVGAATFQSKGANYICTAALATDSIAIKGVRKPESRPAHTRSSIIMHMCQTPNHPDQDFQALHQSSCA